MAFLGTPEPAVVPLRGLVEAGHDVALVVTRPDTRRGRRGDPAPSPVKAAARALGLTVSDEPADVLDAGVELGVVVAYGRIIKAAVLDKVPMVNLHFSLLPRWRGAAPVERAILAGDGETGVCLMGLDEGLDTGPVYARAVTPILPETTAAELRHHLAEAGTGLLVRALRDGFGPAVPQVGEATYAKKLEPAELCLCWEAPAAQLLRVVRVGRAWTTWRGRRLLVLDAEVVADPVGAGAAPSPGTVVGDTVITGDAGLRLRTVQPEGKRPQAGSEWVRNARPAPGEALGS